MHASGRKIVDLFDIKKKLLIYSILFVEHPLVPIHAYIHTYIHTYIYTRILTNIHTYIHTRTGRKIVDLFDIICGTSTGGLLAVALLLGKNLDQIERYACLACVYACMFVYVVGHPLEAC